MPSSIAIFCLPSTLNPLCHPFEQRPFPLPLFYFHPQTLPRQCHHQHRRLTPFPSFPLFSFFLFRDLKASSISGYPTYYWRPTKCLALLCHATRHARFAHFTSPPLPALNVVLLRHLGYTRIVLLPFSSFAITHCLFEFETSYCWHKLQAFALLLRTYIKDLKYVEHWTNFIIINAIWSIDK